MTTLVARFVQAVRDCQGMYGQLNIQLDRLNELLSVLDNTTLREKTIPDFQGGLFNVVPIATRRGAGLSTRRAALHQLSQITRPGLRLVVKIWLDILNANNDLRSHALDDVIDLAVGKQTLKDVQFGPSTRRKTARRASQQTGE